jgi:hypothetical protein
MLNDLRNQASFEPGEEESQESIHLEQIPQPKPRRTFNQMTGTNSVQRFMLALMLLMMVCLMGVMLLVVTGKVVLPITSF